MHNAQIKLSLHSSALAPVPCPHEDHIACWRACQGALDNQRVYMRDPKVIYGGLGTQIHKESQTSVHVHGDETELRCSR